MQVEGQIQASQASARKKELRQQPLGQSSEENVVPPKRRSFFTKNYKVNPFWTSPAEPTMKVTAAPVESGQPCWSDLPEGVLELILTAVKGQSIAERQRSRSCSENRFSGQGEGAWDKTPLLAGGVCRVWHRAVRRVYFSDWWQGPTHIKHPHQLFSLSPWPPLGLAQGLVRCHMRREYTRDGMRFTLFLGDDSSEATCYKFLMVALVSRWDTTLYLEQACTSPPCATIAANVFGTHYGLVMHPSVQPFAAMDCKYDAADAPKSAAAKRGFQMADVEYLTRLRGFMRPRRMRVHLPGPDALLPYRSDDLCRRSKQLTDDLAMARSVSCEVSEGCWGTIYKSSTSLDAVPVAYGEDDAEAEETPRACMSQDGGTQMGPSSAAELRPGRLLCNKQPHWNEKLRCWCLNFKGRVKLASVKNFQLVDAADPSKALVMQFGKSQANTYILDYQSTVISAVQAFAIALSAFDTKLLL